MSHNIEKVIQYANEELITAGNLDVIGKVFAPDYTVHAGGKDYTGHDFIKRWAKQLHSALPGLQVVNIVMLSKSEGTLSWLRTLKGKHEGKFMGILPSGQEVEWNEIVVSYFDGDKIQEEWVVSELAGMLLQSHHGLNR